MSGMEDLRDGLISDWLRARDGMIGQLGKLDEDQLRWVPGPGGRTGLQIARHVADAGSSLTQYALTGARVQGGAPLENPGSREEVIGLLQSGRAEIEVRIRALSDSQLQEKITGLLGNQTTRFNFLAFCYAHEMYHWGQLGLWARAGGEVPELTQNLEARRKKAAAVTS